MSTDRRPAADDGLFIVGLIGRAGSGKSTVALALTRDGGERIDADTLGHEVTDHDPDVRAALIGEYGTQVYRADGTLDRPTVAARVFSDAAARARLDQLVHPRIVRRITERLEALRARGFRGVVVVDAALMLDWGVERGCDAVIAVLAPEAEQVARLVRQRGWTEEEARRRLNVQRTNEEFRAAADVALENRGTPADLERDARAVLDRLRASRGAGAC
jgi:dephospho-CoA kinase